MKTNENVNQVVEQVVDTLASEDRGGWCECRHNPMEKHDVNPPCSRVREFDGIVRRIITLLPEDAELERLREVDERLSNLLGMKEQVVETLREELLNLYKDGEFSYTKAIRKDKIKGQLGQLEYEVKMLRGLLSGE